MINDQIIIFKPSAIIPCKCLKQLIIPDEFLFKSLYLTSGQNSTNCLRNLLQPLVSFNTNKTTIVLLEEYPLFNTQLEFARTLQESLILRRNLGLSFKFNLAENHECYKYLITIVKEATMFRLENLQGDSKENNVSNIKIFFDETYKKFKNNINFKNNDDNYFVKTINPLLFFNIIYTHDFYICLQNYNLNNTVIFIPFINFEFITFVKTNQKYIQI